MAQLVKHFIESPRPCSYLSDRQASLEYRVILECTAEELETMLIRGWRRFGPCYFRPACACFECVSIRIPVANFSPSKSQRRVLKNCQNFRILVGTPTVSQERVALYKKWHVFREDERGWNPSSMNRESYYFDFAYPHPAGREVSIYDHSVLVRGEPKLVGVGICDETPKAWSAVYFYYDPDYAKYSLGVFNVLSQIEIARSKQIPHLYLGFRINDCASMRYKKRFRPHELLHTRPSFEEPPLWVPAPEEADED